MNEYKVIGVDLSKHTFQVCALNSHQKVVFNKALSRSRFDEMIHQLPPASWVAMEACGSSNYWGRKLQGLGHKVTLIPAQYVKPFVKRQKNDAADALAICEAALRPDIHPVPIKTQSQLDMQMMHRIRERRKKNKTAIVNQIRALLREFGIVIPVNVAKVFKHVPDVLEQADNGLSSSARQLLRGLYQELLQEEERLRELDLDLREWIKHQPEAQILRTVPGFGPIVTTALLAAVGNASQFKKSRQLAAWVGLTPRHTGTAGKTIILDTSKAGNPYLRQLIIQGARSVIRWSAPKQDRLSRWVNQLVARRGKQKAIVALANKCTRIAWAVLNTKQPFDWNYGLKNG